MSTKIKRNRKDIDLRGLKLKSPDDIFIRQKNGEFKIKNNLKIYGTLYRNASMILKKGPKNNKYSYVNDVYSLTKKTKNDIVDYFENNQTTKGNKRKIVYLVEEKKK